MHTRKLCLFSLLFTPMPACMDYAPKVETPEVSGAEADIEVSPSSLSFGALELDETAAADLTISNVGDAGLLLDEITYLGTGAFLADDIAGVYLQPGESVIVPVVYAPLGATDEGTLRVHSDDPDEPEVPVGLDGSGLFPRLVWEDDPVNLPDAQIGCRSGASAVLVNDGDGRATVSAVELSGEVFAWVTELELPLVLEAGQSLELPIWFAPTEEIDYEGLIVASSDDPAGPLAATLAAETTPLEAVTDTWWQGPFDVLDVLFTVDQSGSMDDDARELGAQFTSLGGVLQAEGLDYQLAVVTADDGCLNDTIFTADTADGASRFAAAAVGAEGSYTEMGFTLAEHALAVTGSGQCNEGLLREDARTVIVFVSDEPEQSSGAVADHINTLISGGTSVIMHAVAGPVPSGCSSAEAGRGYDEAVTATAGTFLSICDDWADDLAELVTSSGAEYRTSFPLSELPDASTIEVSVNRGVADGWYYDASSNSVTFGAVYLPETGDFVQIDYDLAPDCDE